MNLATLKNAYAKRCCMLLTISLLCLAQVSNASSLGDQEFDGHWWMKAHPARQIGFYDGLRACYAELIKKPCGKLYGESDVQIRLDEFYEQDIDNRNITIYEVLTRLDRPAKRPKRQITGGEVGTPIGWHDGMWWRDQNDNYKLGWIEGFLNCYKERTTKPHGDFRKTPVFYVGKLNGWFGSWADESTILPERENDTIFEALYKFAEKPDTQK